MNIVEIVNTIEQHTVGISLADLALFYNVDRESIENFILSKCNRGDIDLYGNPATTNEVDLALQIFFLHDSLVIHIKYLGYVEKYPGAWVFSRVPMGLYVQRQPFESNYDINIIDQYGSNIGCFS